MEFEIIIAVNILTFLLYGIDKYKAVHKKYRIKESVLLTLPFFFASIGAMLGMIIFNHKTSKKKFRFIIPFTFVINIISYLYVINVL